ncbi:MAG: hypothetical protein EA425_17270 [Puniceicoccaceae bacterium]|nr:MAG: hypothetical protein EA425_17270 [Puniceicoccaceae bacterium]
MSSTVQYITDEHGQKKAVLIAIADYEQLMEDLSDLAAIADRRKETTVSHEKFVAELKKDGILPD